MKYSIKWKKSAVKELTAIPLEYSKRIYEKISELTDNPLPPGSKKLAGTKKLFRIKINDYRVVYSISDEILIVYIIRIAHRKDAYRIL